MKASARFRPRGFWRGLLTGVALAAAAVVALTLLYPPIRFFPPAVDPATLSAPPAPTAPTEAGDFARPRAAAGQGGAAGVASLARVGEEQAPGTAGLLLPRGPAAEVQRPPRAPAVPDTGALPGPPPAAPRLLAPAAGTPLVSVTREPAPDLRGLVPTPPPTVGAGAPSLVPPAE